MLWHVLVFYCFLYMNTILLHSYTIFFYPFISWWLSRLFPPWVIMSNFTTNMCKFSWLYLSYYKCIPEWNGWAIWQLHAKLFKVTAKLFDITVVSLTCLPAIYEGSSFSTALATFVTVFLIVVILVGVYDMSLWFMCASPQLQIKLNTFRAFLLGNTYSNLMLLLNFF